jgi:hypothetical protein
MNSSVFKSIEAVAFKTNKISRTRVEFTHSLEINFFFEGLRAKEAKTHFIKNEDLGMTK